jgi:hypothetical protein
MTNEQLKRAIEKATGEKVNYWTRHDKDGWYEGEASSGQHSVYIWLYCQSKASANGHALSKLKHKIDLAS